MSEYEFSEISSEKQPDSTASDTKPDRDETRRAEQMARNREIGDELDEACTPVVMTLQNMVALLVFVESVGAVAHRVTMRVRKKVAARDTYAASIDFDANGNPHPIFDRWLRDPLRQSVDVLTWRPGKPEFCHPPEGSDAGNRAFNTWRGIKELYKPLGDCQEIARPFFEHIAYLVPDEKERARFLQWLAHILQKPGELPQTCYLMIAETNGIGRNWLASVLTRVLRGYVASGIAISDVLNGSFNGRLSQKLLATVDEAREGTTTNRYQKGQRLKSLITEEHRLINEKYGLQSVQQNCCRWLMFSNFLDALPFDNKDRRVIVIENPSEKQEPAYYEKIYGLLDDPDFIAAVQHELLTRDISDFKPGEHAPMNGAKLKALGAMTTVLDGIVMEFAEEWPGDLATMNDLRKYVQSAMGGRPQDVPKDQSLQYSLNHAGMTLPGKRIKVGATNQSTLIVRNWTRQQVLDAVPAEMAELIRKAREEFKEQGGEDGPVQEWEDLD